MLPNVIDVDEAMKQHAPLLFEDMIPRGMTEPDPKPSNISKRLEFVMGDIEKGFAMADVVIEKEFTTAAVHQGYIEPHACVAKMEADGQGEIWSSSQGHFQMRALTAKISRLQDRRPARHAGGNRRRLRRQDGDLFGTRRGDPVAQVRPAGAAANDAGGCVQGHRSDVWLVDVGEGGRHEGRPHRRR